jgi:hypothetical protein
MIGRCAVAATCKSMSAVLPAHDGAASSTNGGPSGVGVALGVADTDGLGVTVAAGAALAVAVTVGTALVDGAGVRLAPEPAAAVGVGDPFT